MSARDIVLGAASGGAAAVAPTYVDDVFSTYLHTGNGSTQTITNGIDLAGKGGLVWQKIRSSTGSHILVDTARGAGYFVNSNTSNAQTYNASVVSSFNADGFTDAGSQINGQTYVSWTFRKAAKFFDVVTWTGNGTSYRHITHSLGVVPGMIIIKCTSRAGDNWFVWHKDVPHPTSRQGVVFLNTSDAYNTGWNIFDTPTTTDFTVSTGNSEPNAPGEGFVAYLFAHDTAADGMIQCGSYTATGLVNLGFEPQYILSRCATTGANWKINDSMRGITGSTTASLAPNTASAEENSTMNITLAANGFNVNTLQDGAGTYIYMAIRRPNKPPTTGTQVFSCSYGLDTTPSVKAFNSSISVDLLLGRVAAGPCYVQDRLRGAPQYMSTESTGGENASSDWRMDTMNGVNYISARSDLPTRMGWMFKRAPGFFDIVCWTGTGESIAVNHNLTVPPELYIEKCRSTSDDWYVTLFSPNTFAHLNLTTKFNYLGIPLPTSTQFTTINGTSGRTNVSYLFATLAGISKVGSYTGNGSSQNIECGFAAGARFILIKRTDAAGDWYVWDTTRGIAAANDPHLSLNSTAAEVTTDDSIDPDAPGFIVNQLAATNINVASATYIFLAIA